MPGVILCPGQGDPIGVPSVPAINWDQSMATGVDAVDDWNKKVIVWLNTLLAAMLRGKGQMEIHDLLDQLGAFTAAYFAHEEECVVRHKCPAAKKNAAAHDNASMLLDSLNAEFERNGATAHLTVRIETVLMRVLTGHMKQIDSGLYPCVQAFGKTV